MTNKYNEGQRVRVGFFGDKKQEGVIEKIDFSAMYPYFIRLDSKKNLMFYLANELEPIP